MCTGRSRVNSALALLVVAGSAAALTQRASGQVTSTWAAAVNGFWGTASNWSPSGVPNNGGQTYDVFISATGSPYLVTLDLPVTVDNLTIDSPDAKLDLAGFAFSTTQQLTLGPGKMKGSAGSSYTTDSALFLGSGAGPTLLGIDNFIVQGDLTFDLASDIDVCDTGVYHNGNTAKWQGSGNILIGVGSTFNVAANSTFEIKNDKNFQYNNLGGVPTLNNAGVIRKSTGSGVTFIDGVTVINTGTFQAESGTLRTNGVTAGGGTLSGGTWKALNATLDLVGVTVTTNAADVTLDGAGATFAAIDSVVTNAASGKLTVSGGRNFSTAGAFSNNGLLTVGSGSVFTGTSTFAVGSSTITGGGTVKAVGAATFSGTTTSPTLSGGVTFESQAGLTISGSIATRIDNATLTHKGATGQWTSSAGIVLSNGASLTVASGAALTATNAQSITWDNLGATPTVSIAGTFTKQSAGITAITGPTLNNTGTIEVAQGTLQANNAVTSNTLASGTWRVQSAGTVDLVGATILTNQAKVELLGAGASFAALDSLQQNAAGGSVKIDGGRNFLTQGNFTNDGTISIGANTTFQVKPGSDLTNFNTGTKTLSGGKVATKGIYKWDAADVVVNDSDIELDGPDAAIEGLGRSDGLANLATVTDAARFAIINGKNFTTSGDFQVQQAGSQKGILEVGAGTKFRVAPGFNLINFNSGTGEIADGQFDLRGKLQFDNAAIKRIANVTTLDGNDSDILDGLGNSAFTALERIASTGVFTVRGGRDLDVIDPVITRTVNVDGTWVVGDGLTTDSTRVRVFGNLAQNAGSFMQVRNDALLEVRVSPVTGSGGNYDLLTGATLDLQGGSVTVDGTLNLSGTLSGNGFINGDIVTNGVIDPGNSPGLLRTAGLFKFMPGARLEVQLAGVVGGQSFDRIEIAGVLSLMSGVALDVALLDGFVPSYGQRFDIIASNARTGEFTDYQLPGLSNGMHFEVEYLASGVSLVVVPAPGAAGIAVLGLAIGASRRRRR